MDNDLASARAWYPASLPRSNVISATGLDVYNNTFGRRRQRSVHLAARGQRIPVLTAEGGRTVMPGGTSFAAPHVTAVLVLLKAQDPERTWMTLRALLLSGSRPAPSVARTTVSGRTLLAAGDGGQGAMSCAGQRVRRRIAPVEDHIRAAPGTTIVLRALDLHCGADDPLDVSVLVNDCKAGYRRRRENPFAGRRARV